MQVNYVKHNRGATDDEKTRYGQLATHDIETPVLLMYESGLVKDKNGTEVVADKEFLNKTLKATNKRIRDRISSPFAKAKSYLSRDVDSVEHIPIIRDHKTDNHTGQVGYSKGLAYTEYFENDDGKKVLGLMIKQNIMKMEGKLDFRDGMLRSVSPGIRGDGSIKEISYVINPCFPEAGAIFSEQAPNNVVPAPDDIQLSEKQLSLMEEINSLEFQENELNNVIIPNHIVLSKLIRTGRVAPYQYENILHNSNKETLELMERSTISRDLGLMIGLGKHPVKPSEERIDVIDAIEEVKKIHKKNNPNYIPTSEKNKDNKFEPQKENLVDRTISFTEIMEEKLKNIYELCEHSPEIAKKYIRVELGENIAEPEFNDKYLKDYLDQSKKLREKINQKNLELGESNE